MTAKSPQKCSYSYLNSQYIAFLQLIKRYVYKLKLESNFPVQEEIDKTHTDFDRMGPFNAVLRITDNRFWAKKIIPKARQNSCCCLLLSLLKISVCATAMQGSFKCFLDSVAVESNP